MTRVGQHANAACVVKLDRRLKGTQVKGVEHSGGDEFGVGGIDELKTLVNHITVDATGVQTSPDAIRLLDHHDDVPRHAQGLGAAKSREAGSHDNDWSVHLHS